MKNVLKKYKWEFVAVAVLMLLVYASLAISFDFKNYDVSMPLFYQGVDDFGSSYKHAKVLMDGGNWNYETERLGAPFGAQYYDFMPDSLMNTEVFLLKIIGFFQKDPIIVVNIAVFFLFYVIAATAYYAMRQFGIRQDFAVIGAVVFDFSYYHFARLVEHFCLSSYQFVPLSILLCVWLWKDDRLFSKGKAFFKYKKNYLCILFLFLIANNGIGYYSFFTCMFLGITGVAKSLRNRKWGTIGKTAALIAINIFFIAAALIPCITYQMKNGSMLTQRTMGDIELYAMKIIQLLIPYKWSEFWTEYYGSYAKTEAMSSYLGLLAIIGFIILIFALLMHEKNSEKKDVIVLFAKLNVIAVLFATMGGFESIFASFVTGLVRGTNRISIFIAFMSLSTLGILMTRWMKKQNKYSKIWKPICEVLFCALAIFSLYDQVPASVTGAAAQLQEEKNSDSRFIEKIEASVPEKSMIFQLPYHPYPEGGPVNQMQDYHLFIGFMYSRQLRWSYGGSKGREGDLWYQQTAGMPVKQMIDELKKKRFAGIYVDKRAYDEEGFASLDASLKAELNCEPINSANGNLYFYEF